MRKAIFIFIAIILVAASIDFSGPQYENGSLIDGYSYYSKVMANHKLWFVYTMIYPDNYKDVLTRLFKEIDDWQIWERPHLQLKQGESQTSKAVSE